VTSVNYGYTAEEATKPSSWVGTDNLEYTLRTLAAITPTTVNAINTIAGLQAMIESKLPREWNRNMSHHIMYGDTTKGQLQGFRTYTGVGAQSYSWSGGTVGDNRIDAMVRAIMMIPWTAPISVVMNQADLAPLLLLKGGDGHYIQSTSFGMLTLQQVGMQWFLGPWELVFDYAVTEGDFTPVNFADASEFVDQDTASLAWGYIDDDFAKNIIRARYEGTVAHAVKSGQNFVIGTWDNAPGVI
jgi:HK97 family phage major capsid protein